jgi:hypothetical protein
MDMRCDENEGIKILRDFAEGTLGVRDFESQIYTNKKLEEVLLGSGLNWQNTYIKNTTPFLYLAEINYNNYAGRLNAHGFVQLFLERKNITFSEFKGYSDEFDLISVSEPKYIDACSSFIEKYILPQDKSLTKKEQKEKIKNNFASLFKFQSKPPKWIQSPDWIIKNDKPLFFLGQFDIENCNLFHDDGSVYLFVDTETGEIETVKQFY